MIEGEGAGDEGDEKKVTCRRKIQVAAAAKTAIATHFVHAGVQHRIYCYYLIAPRAHVNERTHQYSFLRKVYSIVLETSKLLAAEYTF